YLTAQQQVEQLGKPVNKAIVDTAGFLKEQGKVPEADSDYSSFVTTRFVAPLVK
ncbi:taurine ABC transporter substrate-binding protein, partial [Pantoea endophytica]